MADTVTAKPGDRAALLRDAEYFSTELIRRLEALGEIERVGHVSTTWQQASALTRRVRSIARQQIDEARRNAKRRARREQQQQQQARRS